MLFEQRGYFRRACNRGDFFLRGPGGALRAEGVLSTCNRDDFFLRGGALRAEGVLSTCNGGGGVLTCMQQLVL